MSLKVEGSGEQNKACLFCCPLLIWLKPSAADCTLDGSQGRIYPYNVKGNQICCVFLPRSASLPSPPLTPAPSPSTSSTVICL